MAKAKLVVSVKDTELFKRVLGEITRITSDERISMGVRNEYIARFQDAMDERK